ncbi:hypothetical protein IFM89_002145 [Coptis chinensis]|uniref:ELMO domain-containing protein n=1 Tax=Coptis chinensis TaxID=261450 RepID=A0A835GTQ2_9MAGN|nr:hypothetical protein IFM89_002145 [Coptis chinensis]
MDQSGRASAQLIALVLAVLIIAPTVISARHIIHSHSHHSHKHHHKTSRTKDGMIVKADFYGERRAVIHGRPDTVQVAGSRLPDCSHACGSCRPCRLVMVDEGGRWKRKSGHEDQAWAHNLAHEKRLKMLQERLQVPFDETRPDHQEALRALWHAAFPEVKLKALISEQWKEMGWQGPNPSTDFRLLFKQEGKRAKWEYPFAVAGINVSFMLTQMLDLYSAKPKCLPGINFIKILSEDEEAFDVLYCIAFEMMDAQWLAMRASYMEFNEVLQVTRTQLERELSLEDVHRIQDLPAYNLLYQ